MTPIVLLTLISFIITEKVFVQEWSQFRYGVFDEYGEGLDKWYMPRGQTSKILPSVCSDIEPQFTTS